MQTYEAEECTELAFDFAFHFQLLSYFTFFIALTLFHVLSLVPCRCTIMKLLILPVAGDSTKVIKRQYKCIKHGEWCGFVVAFLSFFWACCRCDKQRTND